MSNPELRERLWPFLGEITKRNGITPRCMGGVAGVLFGLLLLARWHAAKNNAEFACEQSPGRQY
jgi:hypothetical protein